MAHFAEIDSNGVVLRVINISNDDAYGSTLAESEAAGQRFIAETLKLPGIFKQCSYNNNFRKQYPGPGYKYDSELDVFLTPTPYPSWQLDDNFDWQAPIPMPEDTSVAWHWDEDTLSWFATEIPTFGDYSAS